MRRTILAILAAWACTFVHAELKVHFTFESLNSAVGSYTGTLRNNATLTEVSGLPVLSLGSDNGYFDMGASVGNVIATLSNGFTISTNVYIPSTTTLGSNGNFIYTFANSTNIGGDANGCIFFGANETRYTISRTNYNAEKNVVANYRFPTGAWHTLTYRQNGNSGELFLDGERVATGNVTVKPSNLGNTPYNFLGRPCYQGDVYLKDAFYNDFRIYDNAVDDATIASLTANLNALNSGMNEMQINELLNQITLGGNTFYDDIKLPTPNQNGITVTWSSSNESVVSSTGRVTRPAYGKGDARVTLTATLSKAGISKQKSFTINIPALEMSDEDLVDADMMDLTINGHLDNLVTNLYLPTRGNRGSNISWESSQPDILSHEGELLNQRQSKTEVALTATISLRNAVASNTFYITVAPKLPLAYYLFAYFNGNSQWQEQICFALSTDGYNYTPLNNGNPIINSADIALKQAVRDPHILRGEDGYFYMVVTDMKSSEGWSSNDGMVLLRSADMVNWTHTAIDFPTAWPHRFDRNSLTQVWAPQTIYDPEEGKYMVYYAIGESGKNYITYYSYANEDFTELTEPQVLYNHDGMNTIDADIVWHDGKYHMFFKTEGQGNGIQKATAKTLRGEWTPEYRYLQQTSVAVEGSGVFKKIDSDEWVLMYDCYSSGMYEYCTSTDLNNFTWVCNSANTSIFTPRHGTTIAITAAEAQRLANAWPSNGLNIEQSWTDITNYYVKSPRFDDNSNSGWMVSSNAQSINLNFETMEFWYGTFNLYQTIEVPNGRYRLSAQSFYNPSSNESAYLYANEVRQALALRNSEGLSSSNNPGGWDRVTINGNRRYIPNNMEAGSYSFEQGLYNNSLEVEVTDSKLTFGLICEGISNSANWCMFDNFKLEYLGHIDIVTAEKIELSHTEVHLNEGESTTLTATVLPSAAVNKDLIWTSSKPGIVAVDASGTLRANKAGQATITAELADGSGVKATCEVSVTSLGTWIDVTEAYIMNPRFDGNSNKGWDIYANAGSTACGYNAMEFWNGTFNISQTFEIPNGKYRLSVQSYFRTADNNNGYSAYVGGYEDITGYLYANEVKQPIASIYSEYLSTNYGSNCWERNRCYYPNGMMSGSYCFEQGMYNNSLEVEVTDGMLTIGLINEIFVSNNWCMFDNFKLEYLGEYTPVTAVSLNKSEITLNSGESTTLKATVRPTDATFPGVVWSSDNTMIAGVDQNGVVTAHMAGSTIIRATSKDESGLSASCKITVKGTVVTAEGIIINEIQTSNIDMFVDPSYNYGGWMELYNSTNSPVSLNFLYVSDDPDNLTKYNLGIRGSIPAKGYHVLWFDHYNYHYSPSQIDFKLDFDGGTIYISTPDGTLITSQEYPVSVPRTSYARTTNGGSEWGYTASPTPGASNAGSTFATERLDAPVVNRDACMFTSAFTVKVQIPAGATLRYTTDGSTPSLTNGNTSTNGTFQVSRTTTYRFGLFQEGKLPSQIVTRSYIYNDRGYAQIPIISVVTDPVNLYDDELGVYVKGTNGRTGNGQNSPCNWNMDWDRPVNFEFITPEEGMVLNQEVDFAMCGGWSRAWTPHSFKLKAGKIYEGLNSMDYPFFADKPYLKHKTLQIRNGGNDTGCRIKDAALQEIVLRSGLDVDGQSSLPVIHFINGEYKGMLNMREPNNKHFAYANWGIDTDEMDQFEMSPDSGYVQMEGTREAFLEWYELSKSAADEYFYEEIRNIVDIDEYINYMAVELYLGATDWPQNNLKAFRPRIENGRFRFVLFDLDGTFGTNSPFGTFEGKKVHTFDYIYDTGGRFTEEIEVVTIFLNMLQNDSFRKQFIDSYCLVAGSVFEPERCNAIIDEMAAMRAEALSFDNQSPYGTANSLKSSLSYRQNDLINALVGYSRMGLNTNMKQQVSIAANIDDAKLRLNNLEIPTGKFNGTLFAPITLKAEPLAGYKFVGWSNSGAPAEQVTTLIARGSTWYYNDQDNLDGKNWNTSNYSTSSWGRGETPMGFYTGDTNNGRGYKTILNYGSDASNKRPTYYFRTTLTLDKAPTSTETVKLNFIVDDGMVVYVNGVEAGRYLMNGGTPSYASYSSSYATGNPDSGMLTLDASLFRKGTNVIAVEVHNCDGQSSDIYFDAELLLSGQASSNLLSTKAEYTLPSNGSYTLTAVYEPLDAEEASAQLPVRINEVSADNSIYVNDYFKKNDWIELYNTTSDDIDVAGMYLSDNLSKPTKYQIPSDGDINTVIEPHGHLVIWADKLTDLTQLHASFKLAAEGGYLTLTSADQAWTDTLYYEPHLGLESVGLYPDGNSEAYIMTHPTIAKPNIINSYAQWVEKPEETESEKPGTGDDNSIESTTATSLGMHYRDNTLHLHGTNGIVVTFALYDTTGRRHQYLVTELTGGHATISIANLAQGTYIATVTTAEGDTQVLKLKKL